MKEKPLHIHRLESSLSGLKVVASVAARLLTFAETLEKVNSEGADSALMEMELELYVLCEVCDTFCWQYNKVLSLMKVQLPDGMVAVNVPNPHFDPKSKEPLSQQEPLSDDDGGVPPF